VHIYSLSPDPCWGPPSLSLSLSLSPPPPLSLTDFFFLFFSMFVQRAEELARQYLGPSSHIASIVAAALSAQGGSPGGAKGRGLGGKVADEGGNGSPGKAITQMPGKHHMICSDAAEGEAWGWVDGRGGAAGTGSGTKKRPASLQTCAEDLRSPDTVHRSLVQGCGYVHWGHAPTALRHKVAVCECVCACVRVRNTRGRDLWLVPACMHACMRR